MTHSWLAYLPPHLAADLLAHPDVSPLERVLRQQAVALFADISGFTPMSEALGQIGPKGTEELSQILNRTFGTMITLIHSYGGSIGKFAGDALTVVFPYRAHTQRASVRRAVQCALEMQAAMGAAAEQQTSAGTFQLAMKIGVGMGSLLTTTVGDPAIRLEYLLAGNAIDRCTTAEQHASRGAVVVADDLLPLLGGYIGGAVTAGFHQVIQVGRRPRTVSGVSLPIPDATTIATIIRYLPSSIVERLAQQQQGLVDEHRTVTTLFVRFDGFAYQDPEVLPQLQGYLREVVQISDRYGGYLRQVDVGDKGSLFIVLFGAPLAHEDDTERALLCALDLRAAAQQQGVVTATGITTGRVFCGLLGSHTRREYAAIGDSVNLAARLMSAARPDQILVDSPTQQYTHALFHWTTLPPLQVKGKTAPVPVAVLDHTIQRSTRRLRAPSYRLPMVGRQAELQHCFALLDRALQQQGQIVAISAEAGMGKSRLVTELLRSAPSKRFTVLTSECLSYGTQTSYLVWHTLLRGLFDLTPDMPLDAQRQRVEAVLAAIDPMLVERMPLLGVALNLPIPDNELTRQLDAKLRKESLEQLLISCIRCWATQQPLLLILEDCHWIDPLSDDLLFALSQRIGDIPLLLLLTHRPFTTERSDTQITGLQVSTLPYYQTLTLAEFSREETAALIDLKLVQLFDLREGAPVDLVERIAERAQGNPFYIDELLNLLHDRGINPRDAAALLQVKLPDSLQRLILSRIDRLEEGPKTVLKLGSVIGRLFKAHWLWGIAPSLGTTTTVQEHLQLLQERELTQLERVEPEVEYLFKHLITRDVAYESLSLATRTVLHEQVGAYIERTYAEELERWLDMLAYHYGQSANVTKQREYYRRAGDAAHAAFANAAAIHYYTQLLRVLPEEEHGPVQLALAAVLYVTGRYDEAWGYNRQVQEAAERRGDRALSNQAARNQGDALILLGRYDAALETLEQVRTANTALQDQWGLSETLCSLSWLAMCQGDYTRTIAEGTACLELATSIGAYRLCCGALINMGVCAMDQGRYDEAATYFERGIQLATDHNLRLPLTVLTGNLGVLYSNLGKYEQAFAQQQQNLTAALAIGYHNQVLLALLNLGTIYQEVGQDAEAQRCYLAALAMMGEFPDPRQLSYVLLRMMTFGHQNEAVWVERLFDRVVTLCRAFELRYFLLLSLDAHADHCLHQHRYSEAEQSNADALALAGQLQVRQALFQCQVRAIQLAALQGQLSVSAVLPQLEALHREWSEPEQHALIDDTIWQLDPQQEQMRHAVADQYRTLYERTHKAQYRRRYAELTGEWLSAPPLFPAPPPIVDAHTSTLELLLPRVDRLLATRNG